MANIDREKWISNRKMKFECLDAPYTWKLIIRYTPECTVYDFLYFFFNFWTGAQVFRKIEWDQ